MNPGWLTGIVAVLLGGATLSACSDVASDASPSTVVEVQGTVIVVIDGDTIDAQLGPTRERIRLIGINSPESVDLRKPIECFGPEASTHLKELLAQGSPIRVERDVEERDKYGRLLAYVFRGSDAVMVNLQQAIDGFADTMDIRPNSTHAAAIRSAVDDAKLHQRGMWATCPATAATGAAGAPGAT